ncbi:MAG: YbhB/YbcL family Raf kinase inhibitor-like protein [Flavobacteriales bacterium]|nr:YbhB/YbcL family Raf kinase inhibitor-like protein [Flavobacteriales bacterium]
MSLMISSTAFKNDDLIPIKYTCDGKNVSPPIEWKNSPSDTKLFVLIVEDPDSQFCTWNHWIIYNIPNNVNKLREGVVTLPENTTVEQNSWGEEKYVGPCSSRKEHRYFFKLFALNQLLVTKSKISSINIKQLMKPYIIDEAVLIGRYQCKSI